MAHGDPAPQETVPYGKFGVLLGCACLLLFAAVTAAAAWDASHRHLIESSEIVVMPDESDATAFFPAPADLKKGSVVAAMDGRALYLGGVGAVSHPDEAVLAIGLEDMRTYPIYQLRTPPEQGPNYLLLKIAPETYLKTSDRLEEETR